MCEYCEYESLIEEMEEILEYEGSEFARDTLESILGWVSDKGHCTEAQRVAVENIGGAVMRKMDGEWK